MSHPEKTRAYSSRAGVLRGDARELSRLAVGESHDPHRLLGAHPVSLDEQTGVVLRAFHPDAVAVELLIPGQPSVSLEVVGKSGLFATFLPGAALPKAYRLRFQLADGVVYERDDPYRFLPTIGDVDLHLF